MGLFGPKKQSYLGVDLGAGGIKLVELQNEKGRARLFTYGFTERTPESQPTNLVDSPKETAELLKKMVQKAKTSTMRTVAGLPIASVFSSVITVPKGSEREVREAIQWQAKKLIPVPLEEMVLDPKIITTPGEKAKASAAPAAKGEIKKDEQKSIQVLITGASKSMVGKYTAVFKQAGLELVSLETEAFALIRALIGKDRSTTMIVDIGSIRTNIIIVENGIPYVTRSLDMGGVTLTKAMSKALSMDMKNAESMKNDIKSVSTLYPGEGLPKIFETSIAPMLTELQYSMNLYIGQGDQRTGKTIEKIILTGGSAALPSIAGFFAKQLNIKVYLGDPWARVVYPDDLRPVLEEIGPRFAVSVGLAMRDIE
ncbi:MAG TPA: type IV pilus assembly protein PilM [Candidatus Eisenbacteria bacterium]|jgi:type IV pilus assembly protein PilM|nr:type IV pilus assembly protein PilM [Candidatus Eisenbacteria bacterium]